MNTFKLKTYEDRVLDRQIEEACYEVNRSAKLGEAAYFSTLTAGGSVSYSGFEADGTLVMYGDATVWDDSMVPATSARTAAADLALHNLVAGLYAPRVDLNDEVHQIVQFPHSIRTDSVVIKPHIHLINQAAIGAANYNVAFDLEWGWVNIGSAMSATTTTQSNIKASFQNAPALSHKLVNFTDISAATGQGGISSLFFCRAKRVSASTQAYDTNDIFWGGFDVHFEKNTVGSRTPTSK